MSAAVDLEGEADRIRSAVARVAQLFHVFPIDNPMVPYCDGIKSKAHDPRTCTERGKHPTCKWSEWSTQDTDKITRYWCGDRPHNIGIDCGKSGILVVDEDTEGEWNRVCGAFGVEPPVTFTVRTAKGRHIYFLQPDGKPLGNAEGALRGFKINIRGAGGYTVAPGSLHATGVIYKIAKPLAAIVPAPGWLIDTLTSKAPLGTTTTNGADDDTRVSSSKDHTWWRKGPIPQGNRHHALVAAAGWSRQMGLRYDEAVPMIRDVWSRFEGDDVPWEQAEARLDDVYGRYPAGDRLETRRAAPRHYFKDKVGLLVAKLADDIIDIGPLAYGTDDIMWAYTDGVWHPHRHVVAHRAADLLGDRYRRSHGTNAEDVIRSLSPRITCDPISEIINFRNGLYLWQADQLRHHDPDVLTTVQLAVDWNPDATCPAFDAFLGQVLHEDMIPLIWEAIGYLLYSGNPLHRAYMLMGGGRNGKGTLLRVLGALIGSSNFTAVSLHSLVNTRFSTANLFGKLANIAGDIDGTYLESTAMFKAITGQDQITAEHKGRDAFDFTPWAVPVFSANKVPASADTTVGYLSRWLVIPFPNDFTGREDRHLDARLQTKAELQGIAAKAMPALRALMNRGDFDLPGSAINARDEFARRVDQVRMWVTDCCEINGDSWFVPRTTLYRSYKDWTMRDGHKAVKASEFYDRLEAIPGCRSTRRGSDGTRGFTGLRVTDDGGIRLGGLKGSAQRLGESTTLR